MICKECKVGMCESCDDLVHSMGKYSDHARTKPGTNVKQILNGEPIDIEQAKNLVSSKQ